MGSLFRFQAQHLSNSAVSCRPRLCPDPTNPLTPPLSRQVDAEPEVDNILDMKTPTNETAEPPLICEPPQLQQEEVTPPVMAAESVHSGSDSPAASDDSATATATVTPSDSEQNSSCAVSAL